MSHQIRSTIKTKKGQLQRQLTAVPKYAPAPHVDAAWTDEEQVIHLTSEEEEVDSHVKRLRTTVDTIESAQAEWTKVLSNRTADERAAEEKAYTDFMATDANPTNSLDLAIEVIEKLEAYAIKVRKLLSSARLKVEQKAEKVRDQARLAQLPVPPSSTTGATPVLSSVKLPKIQLAKFAGARDEWAPFKRLYKSTIEDNEPSDVVRMTHLLSLLEGQPRRLISSLDISAANYPKAMELLDKEYGDERLQLKELLMKLRTLPECKSFAEVKEFRLQLETTCMQLEALKHTFDVTASTMVCVELLSKLPLNIIKKLQEAENKDPSTWDLKAFRHELSAIVRADENAHLAKDLLASKKPTEKSSTPKEKTSKEKAVVYSTQVKETKAMKGDRKGNSPKKREPTCNYCSGNDRKGHWGSECEKYKSLQSRKERASELKLCSKCHYQPHPDKACRVWCFYCKNKEHITSLCTEQKKGSPKKNSDGKPKGPKTDTAQADKVVTSSVEAHVKRDGKTSVSMCVRADVYNPLSRKKESALVVFDTLSHLSFIKKDLREKLGLQTEAKTTLPLLPFKAQRPIAHECEQVKLGMKLRNGRQITLNFFTTDQILTDSAAVLLTDEDLKKASTYGEWVSGTKENPDLLIGIDQEALFDIKNVYGAELLASGFSLKDTLLGPVLSGRGQFKLIRESHVVHAALIDQAISDEPTPDEVLRDYFKLERMGVEPEPEVDPDQQTHQFFKDTTKRHDDGRFQASLPWNAEVKNLPSNFRLARRRLNCNLAKGKHSPKALAGYQAIVDGKLESDIIEVVEHPEAPTVHHGPIHYLAHQLVTKEGPNGELKFRMILDGAARMKGQPSLNDCLERGPVMLNDLMGVLMRLRTSPIAILSDVAKAFLQVELNPSDRDATRFLWPKDLNNPDGEVIVYRFKRLPFGLKSSPFILAASIDELLLLEQSPLAEEIRSNIYVDNVMLRADNVEEAKTKCLAAKEIFRKAQMPLREFLSNSVEALSLLRPDEILNSKVSKVLGTKWNVESDELIFRMPQLPTDQNWTLRRVTSALCSLYDPLGLLAPGLVPAKRVLQEIWQHYSQAKSTTTALDELAQATKLRWNAILPKGLQDKWLEAIASWTHGEITLPRRVIKFGPQGNKYELHAFCDASDYAFGACVYLVTRNSGASDSQLIMSKVRVRPSQGRWTIPRLELMGALFGARALKFTLLQLGLPVEACYLWIDAMCVVDWIKSPQQQERFVENRRKQIRANRDFSLGHVPGVLNPADILSRGMRVGELVESSMWFHGPEFLLLEKALWPYQPVLIAELPEIEEKEIVIFDTAANTIPLAPPLIDPANYSDWKTLRQVVGYVFKFLKKRLINKLKDPQSQFIKALSILPTDVVLTSAERRFAGLYLVKRDQEQHPPEAKVAKELRIYTDPEDGLLRSRGQLGESELEEGAKYPVFLDKTSSLTKLLILDAHQKLHHLGTKSTLAQLRKTYWFASGRRTVSTAIRNRCRGNCWRLHAERFTPPPAPNLPAERVVMSRVFENTGLDYSGPFTIKESDGSTSKVYVVLFTCMVTRNLHLEVVLDYGAESFILAFRRFVSKRGRPSKIYSDHGSQLNLSAKIVAEAFHSRGFQAFLAEKSIVWRQLTEKAPWTGGFYERLIALTKGCMRRTIGKSILRLDKFTTLISEMEAFLNGRPLTYQSDQLTQGSLRPLRPIDFLFPAGESVEPAHVEEGDDFAPTSRDQLLDKLAKDHLKLEKFKQIFYEEYLPELRERKSKLLNGIPREPILGEVVLIEEDDPRRLSWNIGRVIELLRSRDGRVRTVKLWNGRNVIRRPVCLLYPLEVDPEPGTQEEGRVEIKRKGQPVDTEKREPPKRSHKMNLRNRVQSPSDSNNVAPISVLSMALAEEELVLDYDESEECAEPSNQGGMRQTAPDDKQGQDLPKPECSTRRHRHGAHKHHRKGPESHRQHSRPQRDLNEGQGRSRSSHKEEPHSRSSRRCSEMGRPTYHRRLNSSDFDNPNSRHGRRRSRSRTRSRSPRGKNSKRNQSARRKAEEKAKVEKMRSLLGAIHQKGGVPVINSNRVGPATKRTIINTLGLAKADDKRLAAIEVDRRKLQRETESEQPFNDLSYSDSGLEPISLGDNRDGPRPIDLSMEAFLYHPNMAYLRVGSPTQLVAIFWALRQETSEKTATFAKEILLAEKDVIPMVWTKWRHQFHDSQLQQADADNALNKWIDCSPKAKASMDAAMPKPFRWIEANSKEDAELAEAWIGALHRRLAAQLSKKLNYARVTMIGDSWASQLGLSLKAVYVLTGTHDVVINSLENLFFAYPRCDQQCVAFFTGKEIITESLTDEQRDTHFEELKALWRTIPRYVTLHIVDPPRIPGRDSAWRDYKRRLSRLVRETGAKIVPVPQLTSEEVSPRFVGEAVEANGTLREMGAWIVAEQLSHAWDVPLTFKPSAHKRVIKGLYNFTLDHVDSCEDRLPLSERIQNAKLRRDPMPTKSRSAKLGVASSSVLLVALMALLFPTCASGLMLCRRTTNSLLYNFSTAFDACQYSIHDFNENPLVLKIFERNDKEYLESAWNCVRRVTTVKYHSDWHGDNFATPPEITFHDVTPSECRRWNQSNQAIIDGKRQFLGNELGERRTNNLALLNYPSWYQFWVGERQAKAENCEIIPSVISATTHRDHVVSPAGDSRGCRYSAGECALEDGSALIWTPVKRQLCQYKQSFAWNGSYYLEAEDRWIWTADSQQFSLRFSRDSPRIHDCHETYVLSDQGFGILESDFEKITSARQKRNDLTAARLTASQVHSFKNLRAAVKSIHRMLCKQLGSNWMSDAEATTLSLRDMLNNTYLQADSPLKDIVEVWPCVPAPVTNLTFLRSESCFKHPRVNASIGGETATFHLNTKLDILMPTSDEGSCEIHQYKMIQWNTKLWQLDQLSGQIVDRTDEVKGMPTVLSLDDPLANLGPLTFIELLGANHSDPSEKWEKFLRATRAKAAAQNRKDWHVDPDDDEPILHYEPPFTWAWFLKKLLPSDLVVRISVLLGLSFVAFKLLERYIWPTIAVRLLKKAYLSMDKERRKLEGTMSQMQATMKQMEDQLRLLQSHTPHPDEGRNTDEDHGRGTSEQGQGLGRGTNARKTICRRDYLSDRGFMASDEDVLKPGVSGTNGS